MSRFFAETALVHGSGFQLIDGVQALSAGSEFNAAQALELFAGGGVESIICSGRGPVEGVFYKMSEAELMANYLMARNVPYQNIEIEEQSTSALGNWSASAAIIDALDIESVVGVTARPNVKRMSLIGVFVADRSDFTFNGYRHSDAPVGPQDYARELGSLMIVEGFLMTHGHTPVSELEQCYNAVKNLIGVGAVKRLRHRDSTNNFGV